MSSKTSKLSIRPLVRSLKFTSVFCWLLLSCSVALAQTNVNIAWTFGSWPGEIGFEVINTGNNTVVLCYQPGDLGGSANISLPALPDGVYEVRGFDGYGDGWNGASVVFSAGGDQLLSSDGPPSDCGFFGGCDPAPNVCNGIPSSVAAGGAAILGTFEVPVPEILEATYVAGNIPTNFGEYSSSCNGPLTTLSVTLPPGGPYEVTGLDVSYTMRALNNAWRSEQYSQIYCQNTATEEGQYYSNSQGTSGNQNYNREGVNIANGIYPGGTVLTFEMRAIRSWGGSGCNTSYNYVTNNTWSIAVEYFEVPVCSGTPTPGNTLASAAVVCSGSSVNLSLQNSTPGDVSYQWQSSPDNNTWTNFGNSSSLQSTTVSADTWYRALVNCDGNIGISNPVLVTLNPVFCECNAVPCSASGGDNTFEHLGNVTFAGINNNSGANTSAYGDYRCVVGNVIAGSVYPFSATAVSADFEGDQDFIRVFIDWYHNGNFTAYNIGSCGSTPSCVISGNIAVPADALPGGTLMRVISNWSTYPSNACSAPVYGEVEDYAIQVAEPVCEPPTVSYAITEDCNSSTFNLTVDIGNDGDDTDYEVTFFVDGGSINHAGSFSGGTSGIGIGTFDFGQVVDVTIVHTDDSECDQFFGGLTFTQCPPGTHCQYSSQPGVAISTSGSNTYTNQISTGTLPSGTAISDLKVFVDISHSFSADVLISLESPSGTIVQLIPSSGICGNSDNIVVEFDDAAATVIGTDCPVNGYYRPLNLLSAFDGELLEGTWTMTVTDDTGGDGGTWNSWCLIPETFLIECDAPTVNTSITENCESGTFGVSVDIGNDGDSSGGYNLSYSVDGGAQSSPVNVPGGTTGYSLGSFNIGEVVDLFVEHADESFCNQTVGGITVPFCPPANNLCVNAIPVNCGTTTPGTTVNANNSDFPPSCSINLNTAPGVWYQVQGEDAVMYADLCGAPFDTRMGVFTGTCGSFTCVAGNDDDGAGGTGICEGGLQSSVSWEATSGETYYIYVTAFQTESGAFDLTVECASWEIGSWSDCSESCGDGTQTRTVECVDSDGQPIPDGLCFQPKPDEVQACYLAPCCDDFTVSGATTIATLGFANGSATATASGGILPLSYSWNDPFMQNTTTALGLFPGYYTCVVTDAVGCSAEVTVYVPLLTGIPQTKISNLYCNTGDYDLSDIISCDAVANAEAYRWEFVEQGGSALPEYTRFGNKHLRLMWLNGCELGKTYNVRVKARVDGIWGNYGQVCTITTVSDIPLTEVRAEFHPTNAQGTAYALCDFSSAYSIVNANAYRWRFDPDSDSNNGNEIYYTRGGGNPQIRLSWINGLIPGQIYNVAVETQVAGGWSGFGTTHQIQLASPSDDVVLRNGYCGGNFAPNGHILSESVCEADSYTFEFQPVGGGPVRVRHSANYVCLLNQVSPALSPGQYNVRIKVKQNGVTGNWGPACQISIIGSGMVEEGMTGLRSIEATGSAILFPNPNAGSEVRVILEGLEEGNHNVQVAIYDIYGKKISHEDFGHEGTQLNRLIRFDNNLSMGMYLVQISVDGEPFTTEPLIVK